MTRNRLAVLTVLAAAALTGCSEPPDGDPASQPFPFFPTIKNPEPATPSPPTFTWDPEASQPDQAHDRVGLNAFTMTYPDESQEWCFIYTPSGSYENAELHCKPVPQEGTP